MSKNQAFAPIIVIIALALLLGGGYVYMEKSQTNQSPTVQPPAVAAGITVTYPNGGEKLEVNEQDSMPKGVNFVTRWTSYNLTGTTEVYLISATDGSGCLLGSSPTEEGSFGSVLGSSFKCKNTSKLLTSGQYKVGLKADTQSSSSDFGTDDTSDNYFTLNVVSTNQINSTWKTYTNSRYGFSFQYPRTWILDSSYQKYGNAKNDPHLDLKWSVDGVRKFEINKYCKDKSLGASTFVQPPSKGEGNEAFSITLNNQKVPFYEVICYECYEGTTLSDLDQPSLSTTICNRQGICLSIKAGKSGNADLKEPMAVLSTLKLDDTFNSLARQQECPEQDSIGG